MSQHGLFDGEGEFPRVDESTFPSALLALNYIPNLGIKRIYAIVKQLKYEIIDLFDEDYRKVAEKLPDGINSIILSCGSEDLKDYLNRGKEEEHGLRERGIEIVHLGNLPPQLRGRDDSPLWLFVQGNRLVLNRTSLIGVVGTRKPSQKGLALARRVARVLGGHDVCVVSGLAEGIDDEIHRSSMDLGLANIAFLGHGINRVFPASTHHTRERIIAEGGAIATEYFPDETYQRAYFVQRNRLQAMLSSTVIFVEAEEKSGTAHTLGFAIKYGKRVIGLRGSGKGIDGSIDRLGATVIDLKDHIGMRQLDGIIKSDISAFDKQPRSMTRLLRSIENELRLRSYTKKQKHELLSKVIALIDDEGLIK